MLPHAPGVQMQPIPEDAVQEDSGDEEEEDPEKRISSTCLSLALSRYPAAARDRCEPVGAKAERDQLAGEVAGLL